MVCPAGMVTVAGTVKTAALLVVRFTTMPPVGAGPFRKTRAAVPERPPIGVVGVTSTRSKPIGPMPTTRVCDRPSEVVAVSVTLADDADPPAVAVKLAVVPRAGTVTEAGTGRRAGLEDVRFTTRPEAPAGRSKVTLNVPTAPARRFAGPVNPVRLTGP